MAAAACARGVAGDGDTVLRGRPSPWHGPDHPGDGEAHERAAGPAGPSELSGPAGRVPAAARAPATSTGTGLNLRRTAGQEEDDDGMQHGDNVDGGVLLNVAEADGAEEISSEEAQIVSSLVVTAG